MVRPPVRHRRFCAGPDARDAEVAEAWSYVPVFASWVTEVVDPSEIRVGGAEQGVMPAQEYASGVPGGFGQDWAGAVAPVQSWDVSEFPGWDATR